MKSRRQFIECGTCALFLFGCGDKSSVIADTSQPDTSSPEIDASFDPCDVSREDDWTQVLLSSFPELDSVGGYATISVNGQSMVIAHVEEGCFAAVASRCTHQGGEIFYSAARRQFSCLLHAATFDLDGEWQLGQVTTNLQSYLVAQEGDSLWVNV